MYEEDHSWSFAAGLFVGALAGAALASLFTPRSGPQNRELVMEKGLVLKERVNDAATSTTERVGAVTSTVTEKVGGVASTVSERASSAATTVADKASGAVSTVQEAASTAAAKVSDAASTATEKVSGVASTATEKVSSVASTAATRVSEVASTATERARDLAGRGADGDAEQTTGESATIMSAPAAPIGAAGIDQASTGTTTVMPTTERVDDSVGPAAGQPVPAVEPSGGQVFSAPSSVETTSGASQHDADADIIITDTSVVGEMNAAARELESDEQFDAEPPRPSTARAYTTSINSGTSGGGEIPGGTGGPSESA